MNSYKKCCAQCPGVLDTSKGKTAHECCLPKYVSGNLKISSLKKEITDYSKYRKTHEIGSKRWDEGPYYDRFAIAKKFHADNLKHQPLPDKVDYDMIKNMEKSFHLPSLTEQCQKGRKEYNRSKLRSKYHHDSVLGYKKPETKMDLAICWQTPVDPTYEPPRPTHIDGSEGGAAPAIFELIQHTPNTTRDLLKFNDHDTKYRGITNDVNHREKEFAEKYQSNSEADSPPSLINKCTHRCRCMNSKNIDKERLTRRSRSQYSIRNTPVHAEKEQSDPRLIRSAVGIALGTESNDNMYRRLPQKVDVPRPKTPFARRSFSIETLAPPFSIRNGCRDTDYPENRRLMTVYQQSYKNPRKSRGNFH